MPRLRSFRSQKRRDVHRKKVLRLCLAWIFAIVTVGVTVVLFFNSRFFDISSIVVQGGSADINEQVQSIVYNSIKGDFLWFMPKNSIFFFPYNKLSASISAEFPSVAGISIDRNGLTDISIKITMRSPYAVVCIDSSNNKQGARDCYYVDENGVIFETASSTAGFLTVYSISLPNDANPIGIDFLNNDRLESLSLFVNSLSKLGFTDEGINIPESLNYDLSLVSEKESTSTSSTTIPIMHLFIDESRPFSQTLDDFTAFWQEYKAQTTSTDADELSSVDMRYGNNIIYKTR